MFCFQVCEETSRKRTAYFYLQLDSTFHVVLSRYDYEFGTKSRAYKILFKGKSLTGQESPRSLDFKGDKELIAVPCERGPLSSDEEEVEFRNARHRGHSNRAFVKFYVCSSFTNPHGAIEISDQRIDSQPERQEALVRARYLNTFPRYLFAVRA